MPYDCYIEDAADVRAVIMDKAHSEESSILKKITIFATANRLLQSLVELQPPLNHNTYLT